MDGKMTLDELWEWASRKPTNSQLDNYRETILALITERDGLKARVIGLERDRDEIIERMSGDTATTTRECQTCHLPQYPRACRCEVEELRAKAGLLLTMFKDYDDMDREIEVLLSMASDGRELDIVGIEPVEPMLATREVRNPGEPPRVESYTTAFTDCDKWPGEDVSGYAIFVRSGDFWLARALRAAESLLRKRGDDE